MTENTEKKRYIITQNEYNENIERVLNCFELWHVGLGNRLKQLFTNMRFHEGQYDTINIHWPIKGWVESPFKELFDFQGFPRINELNYSVFLDNKCKEEATWSLCLKPEETRELMETAGINQLNFEYNKIPQKFIDLYKPYFMALKPAKLVQDLIDTIEMPEKCVSVHIRHMADWKEWNRWNENDINLFLEEMHKYDEDTYFYAACQCAEVREIVMNEFKNRIIALPRDYSKKDNIRDTADMFLLSKNKKLIGTYGSTFTECVWWLSGCTQEVTIIGSANSWENGGLPDYMKPR